MSELTPTAKVTYTLHDYQLNNFLFFIILRVVFSIRYEDKKKETYFANWFLPFFFTDFEVQCFLANVHSERKFPV